MSGAEGTLALSEGSRVLWTQQQALAAVQQAVFTDLPAPSAELEATIRESAPTLRDRIQRELIGAKACALPQTCAPALAAESAQTVLCELQEQFGFALPEDRRVLAHILSKMNDRLWPSRDADGFRKQIVVRSRYGARTRLAC